MILSITLPYHLHNLILILLNIIPKMLLSTILRSLQHSRHLALLATVTHYTPIALHDHRVAATAATHIHNKLLVRRHRHAQLLFQRRSVGLLHALLGQLVVRRGVLLCADGVAAQEGLEGLERLEELILALHEWWVLLLLLVWQEGL